MRAIVMLRHGPPDVLQERDLPVPEIAADQLLVRVTACGVCGHDVLSRQGRIGTPAPMVLGHEIAGVVARAGADVGDLVPGDRVALVQRVPCGRCADCLSGATNHCRKGLGFYGDDLAGGYADYVVATERNAVRLPPSISDETGAILSCGVGTGLRAVRAARIEPGDVVVVTGAGGGVGVHAVQLARRSGAQVLARTTSLSKEATLRACGASEVVLRDDPDALRDVLRAMGRPRGADVVLEIAGPPTFATSLAALAPHGRLVLVGNTEPSALNFNPGLVIVKELSIIGSAHATKADLQEVIALVEAGEVNPVAARTWPLAAAADAHRALEQRTIAGRAVLAMAMSDPAESS